MIKKLMLTILLMYSLNLFADADRELVEACENGDLNKVKQLVTKVANVNSIWMDGERPKSPLGSAIANANHNIIRYLLEKNASPNLILGEGFGTPFSIAIGFDDITAINLLLEKGVDFSFRSQGGRSYLMLAAQFGKLNALNIILTKTSTIDAEDNIKKTALFYAVMNKKVMAAQILMQILIKN